MSFNLILFSSQQHQAGDTECAVSHRLAPPTTEGPNLQDVQEEDTEYEQANGKVVKSSSDAHLNTSSGMWLICCRFKIYRADYQVIHSEANYRFSQVGFKTAVRAGGIIARPLGCV